ncbi:hypothetical protein CEUSTIGMA_g12672.t1 [Chlamydomonas eustigma]|uniref:Thioredoxin domain-containing protein n=1 Tax=Chlamydomonas eustigma TaxID=1157962 RepID=A0A250XQN8_9CHLO|nr:hypothetical protein CEUSTIGMA_g12672.t1 [Chlamydomonas eustigma]|eukprot:GAX85252.1 hypothetical protein CEUSTIGMA_g12672.t1 [Chlamydomonas eustigma]
MEIAWQRQQEQEVRNELKRTSVESGEITEVEDLAQLDLLLETAGSRLVLLFLYSKACGVCKEAKLRYSELSQESKNQRARVAFLQHNIVDEYDQVSDIARWCGVKAVPCFLFLDGGAVIDRVSMRDMRRLAGSKNMVRTKYDCIGAGDKHSSVNTSSYHEIMGDEDHDASLSYLLTTQLFTVPLVPSQAPPSPAKNTCFWMIQITLKYLHAASMKAQ